MGSQKKQLGGMQSNPEASNQLEPDPGAVRPCSLEPWWHSVGYNSISVAQPRRSGSNSSSDDSPNSSESNNDQSVASSRLNEEEEDAIKDSHATASSQSARNREQEQYMQHGTSSMNTMHDSSLTCPPQLELVGHTIAGGTNSYLDPYYGMMAAYGHQSLGYPHFVGMHQTRMPLPHEMAQEPVYVNAKQYQGILRRREARAKAEVEKKLIKVRKPYLHESRHQHAMRRARGTGGRFAKKSELKTSKLLADASNSNSVPSLQSHRSSVSELPSDHVEAWNSMVKRDSRGVQNTFEAHTYLNGGGFYQSQRGVQASSKYDSHRDQNGDNGDCSGQQRGSISSSQASHRTLAT